MARPFVFVVILVIFFFLNVARLEGRKNRKMVAWYAGESPSRVTFKRRKVMKKNSSVVLGW